ncbi:MAG: pyridine nucleotide-disulfide oxidoreductase, partial [Cloacibacillus sp.]
EEASAAMVEGRIAGHSAAAALGLKTDAKKFDEYWTRLDHLRAGEVGEKILAGIGQVLVSGWEA